MNRSTIYKSLKNNEFLRSLRYREGKGYVFKFVPNIWTKSTEIRVNNAIIKGFYSITVMIQKVVIEDELGNMEIHIWYKNMENFDVYIE